MNFNEAAGQFSQSESGTDSFKKLFKAAYQLMKDDPENAVAYFVIAIAAQAYVTRYEDQGVEPAFADKAKSIMDGFNRRISAALEAAHAEKFAIVSHVAHDYQFEVAEF